MRNQNITREIVIQGQVEPWKSVQVSAETVGIVSKLMVKKGQRVTTGDLLLELRMDGRKAQQNEAQALLKLRHTEYSGVQKLQKRGLQSKTDLAVANAQLETAKAVAQKIEVEIQHTRVRAPFAGVINEKFVVTGDFLERGNPALTLVDDSRLLAVGYVPQHSIKFLRKGLIANITLITGESMSGEVSFVSATSNPETRSYRIEVEVDNKDFKFIAGISGEIHIPVEQVAGHFISPSILTLSDSGELGVKTVDASNHVIFRPVTIISHSDKGSWVSGLPDSIQIISLGHGFVRAGDEVLINTIERG